MELFHRHKEARVRWDREAERFVATVDMRDAFHDMGVEVHFSYPDLVILDVRPRMDRTPYPVCPGALVRAAACVGEQVGPGLTFKIGREIGGPEGCTHVTTLVLDACHAAVQGLLSLRSAEEGAARGPLPAADKIAFLEGHNLSPRNTCLAYALPLIGEEVREEGGTGDP
jgi:hypothetical protein